MFPANTWVVDLEIQNAIPDKKTPPLPGIRYCKHWGDHSNMGIAVVSICRPDGSEVQDFTGDTSMPLNTALGNLMDLNTILSRCDLVITYGGRVFDSKVLAARGIYLRPAYHLDFLYEVKKAINNQAPKGWKLSDASARVGFAPKDFDGAMAPVLWQQGRYQEVIEYCHTDIFRTCALADFYARNGASLIGPDSTKISLRTIPQIIANP